MWELVVPLSATQELAVNTDFCWGQEKDLAKEIIKNRAGQIVAVSWEHTKLPVLVGWLLALGENEKATAPKKVEKWDPEVFDQYWIVDFRGASPKLLVEPQKILSSDCPVARDEKGRCLSKAQPPS